MGHLKTFRGDGHVHYLWWQLPRYKAMSQTSQIIYYKYIQFTVCQLYHIKVALKECRFLSASLECGSQLWWVFRGEERGAGAGLPRQPRAEWGRPSAGTHGSCLHCHLHWFTEYTQELCLNIINYPSWESVQMSLFLF